MIFLKKLFAGLSAFILLFLSGCVQKDLIDIYTFSERFSKHSESFQIDTKTLLAKEDGESLSFPLNFSDKFLLTVYVSPDTSLLTCVTLTYSFYEKKHISDKDFSDFSEIAESAARAFTNRAEADKILSEIGLKNKNSVLQSNHNSLKNGFYNFSFLSDDAGFYFSISTERR